MPIQNVVTKHGNQGFTIVELVVVIILLGILAATALPRFIDVDDSAHAAAFEGVLGGYQTGIALYHAQWIADGQDAAGTQIPEFGNLRATTEGFPYATTANAGNEPTNDSDCAEVFTNLMQNGPSIAAIASTAGLTTATTEYTTQETGNTCVYYYSAQSTNTGDTIPSFTYNPTNGLVVEGTTVIP